MNKSFPIVIHKCEMMDCDFNMIIKCLGSTGNQNTAGLRKWIVFVDSVHIR